MADFRPGRELNAAFHAEVIAPLLAGRPYSAALLGFGSDVLGYDDAVSTDHGWARGCWCSCRTPTSMPSGR